MAEIVESGGESSIVAAALRLVFRWSEDRWVHAIHVSDAASGPLAWSIEGSLSPPTLPSPVYQDLHFQKGPAGTQALLVGQAGEHHFSAVFTVRDGDGPIAVEVDVADRCRGVGTSLATTYAVAFTSSDLIVAGPLRIAWQPAALPGALFSLEPIGPEANVMLAEAGRRATRVQALARIAPGASTQRLIYRWCWTLPDQTTLENDSIQSDRSF
jgi:hypothetical protein